tara:strand:+ start:50 stop:934 length:885 start_codon:yes stop_codon:yes gene_type:complete
MNKNIQHSLIIPIFNEKKGIENTLKDLEVFSNEDSFEVILVDDGSTDGTAKILSNRKNINLVKHDFNKGYGAALKTGIKNATGSIICIADADGTYPLKKLFDFVDVLVKENLDMVVGARTGESVQIPLIRKPAKWFINMLANYITGEKIPDINSGLRVFRKEAFLPFIKIIPNGFSFTTTITLGMLSGKYKIKFIPINYFFRLGKSKIKPIRDTLNFIKLILRIGLYFAPLKVFMPVGLSLLFISLTFGFFSKIYFGVLPDVSLLILAMSGFQIICMALIAELINHRLPNQYIK